MTTPNSEVVDVLQEKVQAFLDATGLEVALEMEVTESNIYFNVTGDEHDYFSSHRGEILRDITFLLHNYHQSRFPDHEAEIKFDADRFLRRKEKELSDMAMDAAREVLANGSEIVLQPMNPYERRVVHMALQDMEEITTESRGEGHIKRIAVLMSPAEEMAED